MQITNTEIQGTKYVQIYLTEDELQKKETKDLAQKYKQEKYIVCGRWNYIKEDIVNFKKNYN